MSTSPCDALNTYDNTYYGEGFIAEVDVLNAQTALEDARYAASNADTADALTAVAGWLRRAQNAYGARGDERYADRCACAAATVEGWTANGWGPDLAQFQSVTLYQFAGLLAALRGDAIAEQLTDSNIAFLAILGIVGGVLVVQGMEHRKAYGPSRPPAPDHGGLLARARR